VLDKREESKVKRSVTNRLAAMEQYKEEKAFRFGSEARPIVRLQWGQDGSALIPDQTIIENLGDDHHQQLPGIFLIT
jgi:hypothetical protein